MTTYFISDLHLQEEQPGIVATLEHFLATEARGADALYILGDLFESWIGDDDDAPFVQRIQALLRDYTESGVPTWFMHGNRDFLIGERFAQSTGIGLLPESVVIDLHGEPTLLLHGDTLCTDDVAYQKFRAMVRNPAWQTQFLSQPLEARRAFARHAREESRKHGKTTMAEITDVTPAAVDAAFAEHGVRRMIHGHTHRPAEHSLPASNGAERVRTVLGDWRSDGAMILRAGPDGSTLSQLR